MVQIRVHTGTADTIYEMMNKGLVDIGLYMEPVNLEGLDYIRFPESDHWVVGMRPDDSLAEKSYITKEDLLPLPLILPERSGVQSELANWFGKDFAKLNIAFTSNLGTNAAILAMQGHGAGTFRTRRLSSNSLTRSMPFRHNKAFNVSIRHNTIQ